MDALDEKICELRDREYTYEQAMCNISESLESLKKYQEQWEECKQIADWLEQLSDYQLIYQPIITNIKMQQEKIHKKKNANDLLEEIKTKSMAMFVIAKNSLEKTKDIKNMEYLCREIDALIREVKTKDLGITWNPLILRDIEEEDTDYSTYDFKKMIEGVLPEDEEEVLIAYKNGTVDIDTFLRSGNECWFDSNFEIGTDIVAWAKMPEGYVRKDG